MAQSYAVKVVDHSHVAPTPGSIPTTTIPLTFLDVGWLFSRPMQRIFFYDFPYPTLHFTQIVFPHLKHSLSCTLHHFFPFAANLRCHPPPNKPYILYKEGDSIRVTVSESDADFNHLIANHARDNEAFQALVPKLPMSSLSLDDTHLVPIMVMQVTIFPNSGISIGITFNHVAADGRSFNHFMKSWASIHRSSGAVDLTSLSLPNHKKDLIKDPDGLSSVFFNQWCDYINNLSSNGTPVSQDNVRLTMVLNPAQIEKLKQLVTTQRREVDELEPIRISTYAVTCAFMWVNLMKLQESETSGHLLLKEDTLYHFVSVADCRERFAELPIPAAYFGNCLALFFVSAKRSQLMGKNGIVVAAKAIARTIRELEKGPLVGAEKWLSKLIDIVKVPGNLVSVAGSPKFRVYETDFGWGRPKKSEVTHMGAYGSFSLNECRDEEGAVEIGFVIGREKLNVFDTFLEQLTEQRIKYSINGEILSD